MDQVQFFSLREQYNRASTTGKVLDVSYMNVNTGAGSRMVSYPQPNRSNLFWTNNLSIASRSLPQYIAAIQLIFGNEGFTRYNADIVQAAASLQNVNVVFTATLANQGTQGLLNLRQGSPASPGRGIYPPISPVRSPRVTQVILPNATVIRTNNLATKLQNIAPGYVLDVSNMNADGSGVRQILRPTTRRSGKFGTENIPVVSNNIINYVRALKLAYGDQAEEVFANDINAVNQALMNI